MSNKEKIEAVLSLYKDAIKSYSFDNHYRNNKSLEQGFDRQLMTDKTSSLYDAVSSLFLELRLSEAQALRYISRWESRYIIDGEVCEPDRASYNRLQAIGRAFIVEAKRIAAEVCEPDGVQPQGGGGTYHQNKVQQNKTQTETEVLDLPDELNSDIAKTTFAKAITKGYIMQVDNGYRRQSISKAQLAYMLQRIYLPDATGADGKQFPETALNELFDEKRLGEALRKLADNKNTDGKPRGYKVIDELFNNI